MVAKRNQKITCNQETQYYS